MIAKNKKDSMEYDEDGLRIGTEQSTVSGW